MIRQRSRPMPTSVAQGFRSMRPNQGMGKPGLAAMSPEQLKALQDRQAQGMAPQGVPNPDVGAALRFMQGTPIPAELNYMKGTPTPAGTFKKGGMVKKASKVSSASKRADGCSTKGKTKGRMV